MGRRNFTDGMTFMTHGCGIPIVRGLGSTLPRLAIAVILTLGGAACTEPPKTRLDTVRAAGELVVATRNGPTTYYEGPYGYAGLEYDLVTEFAEYLGVQARFVIPETFSDIIPTVVNGQADMAAAGLAVTAKRAALVRFTAPYQEVRQQLIYRFGTPPPTNIKGLYGQLIEVQSGRRYIDNLVRLKEKYPDLSWTVDEEEEPEALLQRVWEGLADYTITDSHIFEINRRYYPELRVAFDLAKPERLAWAFAREDDNSLYDAAQRFLRKIRRNGELQRVLDRNYGAAAVTNPVNMTVFRLRVQNRLPLYKTLYQQAGKRYEMDWRMLAAIGYQESYWDPEATSPTGVRGIMQLTQATAKQMGVDDRLDPEQAIDGGSKYIRLMMDRLPEDIVGPDRAWMALASYNVGLGHLMDARLLTRGQGGDPNAWNDVKDRLLLLSRHRWYKQTHHGYARGYEAVRYVTRIRNYYQALVKHDDEERLANTTDAVRLKAPAI